MERHELTIDGARLVCRVAGPADGEPLLLMHGYLGSHATWRAQIAALADPFRVVAPDWFGWGESEQTDDASYEREVARIGEIADTLGWERFDLVTHDYGGFIGLGFVQEHANRVRRFAIMNSRAHATFQGAWRPLFAIAVVAARLSLLRWLYYVLPLRTIHRLAVREEQKQGIFDETSMLAHTRNLRAPPLVRTLADYRVPPREELAARLGAMEVPTAVVWGARDKYLDVSIARELVDAIPDAELHLLEEAGHFVSEERPDEVSRILSEFLAR